ncbi:metallophosphoesterase [Dermacoccus nishinomiyaensis]|uniref:metallophosphoesterase n=1 Tax=Dermacoccus nishinomiyaensis TaxID=1274 RepID=UPI001F50ED75|nr:metallophosphoesterase [Dermacoccus nishinomiyaensis]
MFRSAIAVIGSSVLVASVAGPAVADCHPGKHTARYSFAVIGDLPYGEAQIKALPSWIDQINADPDVRLVQHVGDIKNGSTRCDTSYFRMIKSQFDRFADPLVYSPGDNEWTDCHRANNGSYNPLERLAAVRQVFFPKAGVTNGRPQHIDSINRSFPEIVTWNKAKVSFAALHVVGSNDDLNVWDGIGKTTQTPAQVSEQKARMNANLKALRAAFADAKKHRSRAVSISMQADMFDPTYDVPWANDSAFKPLVEELVKQSNAFRGPVYLFNGDSHVYNTDKPLAAGSKWLSFYGVTGSADNLTRVTVDGSSNNADWLKVRVVDGPQVLTWQRVPYTVQAH